VPRTPRPCPTLRSASAGAGARGLSSSPPCPSPPPTVALLLLLLLPLGCKGPLPGAVVGAAAAASGLQGPSAWCCCCCCCCCIWVARAFHRKHSFVAPPMALFAWAGPSAQRAQLGPGASRPLPNGRWRPGPALWPGPSERTLEAWPGTLVLLLLLVASAAGTPPPLSKASRHFPIRPLVGGPAGDSWGLMAGHVA